MNTEVIIFTPGLGLDFIDKYYSICRVSFIVSNGEFALLNLILLLHVNQNVEYHCLHSWFPTVFFAFELGLDVAYDTKISTVNK